jgi:hypothetical protein
MEVALLAQLADLLYRCSSRFRFPPRQNSEDYLAREIRANGLVVSASFLSSSNPRADRYESPRSNLLFVAAATSAILGLTWGGVTYAWSSYQTLLPLILGLVGIVSFIYLERFSKHPTVPFNILTHYTSVAGYIICFLHSLLVLAVRKFDLFSQFQSSSIRKFDKSPSI